LRGCIRELYKLYLEILANNFYIKIIFLQI